MSGVSKCLKYSMFAFNFLFWLCGCVILGVSIYLRVSKDAQKQLGLDESSTSGLYVAMDVMIAVGSLIMVLGFLGCCGAMKESQCMLLLFFIGLFLILAIQITAGVLGVVYKSKVEEQLNKTLSEMQFTPDLEKSLNIFQKENKCCGLLNGYKDWNLWKHPPIPASCDCAAIQEAPTVCTKVNSRFVYAKSCGTVIKDFFKDHLIIIIGIAFGLALIEIIGLGFSMTLYCQIGKK